MCIPAQVFYDLIWSAKGGFGVYLPPTQGREPYGFLYLVISTADILFLLAYHPEEDGLVHLFECRSGEEELAIAPFWRCPLALSIYSAPAHHTVEVNMVVQFLPPGMQYGSDSGCCPRYCLSSPSVSRAWEAAANRILYISRGDCIMTLLNVNYGFDSTNEYLYLIDFQTLALKPDGLILFSIDKKVCKKSQKV